MGGEMPSPSVKSNNPWQSVMQTLPPGYKQTDVGVIPQDWEVVPLRQLILSVEYGSSAKSNVRGDIPVLRMGNLQDGALDWSDLVYTNDKSEIEKYALDPGDVLFNRTNTIDLVGKTSIYRGERPAIFAGYLIRIKVEPSRLDSDYLNYVLNAEFSKKHSAKVLSVAVAQANINGQKVRTYPIPIPPTLAEQQAIAEALSDVDALISVLDRLIAKKRAIKQGAMQKLLTGKRRLPGFDGEWEIKRLGEIVEKLVNGGTPSTQQPEYWAGHIPWITGADILDQQVSEIRRYITEEAVRNSSTNIVERGSLLLVSRTGVGKLAIAPFAVAISQDFTGVYVRQDRILPEFLFRFLDYKPEVLRSQNQGTSIQGITRETLIAIPVPVPQLTEQAAIAAVLSDMDAEIAALERRRDKTKLLKQGMMQELLAGKIRLV